MFHFLQKTPGVACPPEIQAAVLSIIAATAVEIRGCDNLRVARVLASQIHNLPDLIADYSVDKLARYWPDDKALVEKVAAQEGYHLCLMPQAWSAAETVFRRHLS
ncbi:hypothetical protein ABHF91_16400 [Pseudaeromonas sp. ZJS20]|uniref:hypothetical protein n=1 Tax=Pseudaeromonas aegiceratis TaxID=3153928 RepID=UPI00390CCADC